MPERLRALPWFGGKGERYGWILSNLPDARKSQLYAEPFAGMLSILLNREPAKAEIANDANGRIVNFWKALREHPDELERLVRYTPNSRKEYIECLETLDEGSSVDRARKFIVVVYQSLMKADNSKKSDWYLQTKPVKNYMLRNRIAALASRMINVQLECLDAVEFLNKLYKRIERFPNGDIDECVIYIDPPYRNSDISHYSESVDVV